jgi:hypothetical protein
MGDEGTGNVRTRQPYFLKKESSKYTSLGEGIRLSNLPKWRFQEYFDLS